MPVVFPLPDGSIESVLSDGVIQLRREAGKAWNNIQRGMTEASSVNWNAGTKKTAPENLECRFRGAGDGLLSRVLSDGVPSALQVLTLVFGMGTGVAPAL